jgi:hypothetical protein
MARHEVYQNDPHLGEALTSYCFGGLPDDARDEVERHLMACNACWQEFQRLDAAVRTLRFDATLELALPGNDVISLLGLSSRLGRPFGGHLLFALTIAGLYGLEWTIGVWSELGYAYDRFGRLAWALSVPVAGWVVGSLLVSLSLDVTATRAGGTNGLARSTIVILSSLGVLMMCLLAVLPAEPTIRASFQTRTAAVGYLKDAVLLFLPLLVFIVPVFHAIVWLQRELRAGHADMVLGLLAKRADALIPRGMWFLSSRFLTGFLLVAGTLKIVGTNYMLDALKPGPYAGLFSLAAYLGTGVWLAIAVVSLAWYANNLNELKREATALAALTARKPSAKEH